MRYRVEGPLGRGGSKDVFRAVDTRSGRSVALAILRSVDPERFAKEVTLARRIRPEHVPAILDAYVDEAGDGQLVMELLDGPTLAELAPLPLDRARPIMLAFARGLAAVHEAHVLHRDVKLENAVVSSSDGGGKLTLGILDFGIAESARDQMTSVGVLPPAGTFGYVAPEVILGEEADARTDVYALGVCFFRLLTGEFPLSPAEPLLEYFQALRDLDAHDLNSLRGQPPAWVAIIGRMLAIQRDGRPYMPEVVAALEALPLGEQVPAAGTTPVLRRIAEIPVGSHEPDSVAITPCPRAPMIILAGGGVHAFDRTGARRWSTQVDAELTAAIHADLDGDGLRETYLAGPERLAALDPDGQVLFSRPSIERRSERPALIPSAGRLVVDGFVHGRDGAWIGPLPFAYEGDGVRLRDAGDPSGVSYNGVAHQAYRGSFSTPAAILQRQGADSFQVAHLESGRESPRVYLAVYGPGGKRLHRAAVATPDVPTGDRAAIARMFAPGAAPTFGPREAPIALLGAGDSAVVIAPLPRVVVAIGLPRGREIWRRGSSPGGRALLADLDGGGPALLMATGAEILAMDPWSGRDLWTLPFAGVPVAAGDPFGSGFVHLFSSTGSTLEVWRGQKCLPGLMQWSGLRGDLWRTGTLRPDGTTVGPI